MTLQRLSMLLGLLCGLLVTETIFYIRDDGAFPHVNFYVHDTFLGVRLKPHAKARIRFNQNPITRVRINASGYRGPDFPPRSDSEIIVVGDSQVFGLGVEESETFSARLAEYTGRSVINAGVPTYGPIEYSAVATDLIAERKPKTLIYTINFANDLFERDRPNRTRHAIWDGWAVRIETAPDYTIPFPGREWLYQKSHAFYALRRYLHSNSSIGRTGYPSEGTWRDIIDKSQVAKNPNPVFQSRHQTLDQIEGQLTNIEREINREIRDYHPNKEHSDRMLHLAKGSPGDIISELYGEESRDIEVTAKMIAQGMRFREETIQLLLENETTASTDLRQNVEQQAVLLKERSTAVLKLVQKARIPSAMRSEISILQKHCEKHNVQLVVLALPIDVQVSSKEWLKYGVANPIDISESLVLLEELVADANELGALGINAGPALQEASPGAFLFGDLHMNPKGHAAVAKAIAQTLSPSNAGKLN